MNTFLAIVFALFLTVLNILTVVVFVSSIVFMIEDKQVFYITEYVYYSLENYRIVGKILTIPLMSWFCLIETISFIVGYFCLIFTGLFKLSFNKCFSFQDYKKTLYKFYI